MNKRQEINEELDRIRGENGGVLKPKHVVDFARDPNTALHSQFTWDNTKAAAKWRLEQAARVMRLYLVKPSADDQAKPIRALVSLRSDRLPKSGLPGYRAFHDVMENPEQREDLIQTVLMELRAVRRKYEHLKELSAVWDAIKKIDAKYVSAERRASA